MWARCLHVLWRFDLPIYTLAVHAGSSCRSCPAAAHACLGPDQSRRRPPAASPPGPSHQWPRSTPRPPFARLRAAAGAVARPKHSRGADGPIKRKTCVPHKPVSAMRAYTEGKNPGRLYAACTSQTSEPAVLVQSYSYHPPLPLTTTIPP